MDILFLIMAVLVILLSFSLYYNFSNKRHLKASIYPVRNTIGLHVNDVRLKKSLKKKRKYVSIQSDLSNIHRPFQSSNINEGSDEITGDEEDRDRSTASSNISDNNTESENELHADMVKLEDEYKMLRSFLNEDELTEYIQSFGIFQGLCLYVSDHREEWENKPVKIAVAGNSGTGKSSLINALRGINPGDEGAAEVGVTETTIEPVAYTFPKNDKLLIVDLPGMGTINFPKEKYMTKMKVPSYDAFIIVASGRITENDVWFVKEAMKNNKHVLFVRTKTDIDLANAKCDNPKGFKKETCLIEIKDEIRKTFNKELKPGKLCEIYLVSSRERDRYDFPKLNNTLEKMLNVFGRAMRNMLEESIQSCIAEKRELNKGEFLGKKMAAFFFGLLPGKRYDLSKSLIEIREVCLRHFYLDDQSLVEVSIEIDLPVYAIKDKLKSFVEDEKKAPSFKYPFVKSILRSFRYYHTLQYNLSCMCDEMADDEMTLLDMKLDSIEKELSYEI